MSSLVTAFVGSLEATASVLLTIGYGTAAGYLGLVSDKSAIDLSSLAVKLFMPCLLFIDIGSGFSTETIGEYIPIIIWGLGYNIIAIFLGVTATRIFKLPAWVTAATTFNNSTSLPLLLLQSFAVSGALLPISGGDSVSAISRAKSYFLVNAAISNTLTFSLGPRLLVPEEEKNKTNDNGPILEEGIEPSEDEQAAEGEGEGIPLIIKGKLRSQSASWTRSTRHFLYQFWNAPFIGACIGIFVGLIPVLHRAFFDQDGVLRAWLTVSLNNIGNLFASTQVIIVGIKLCSTYMKMRQGQESGSIPLTPTICVLVTRFIVMPLITIPIIYGLAAKTKLLSDDPILWFCMMMMPVGPSAMRLSALADVSKADEKEKMAVAKFLAVSYIVTPMISFAAVASLKACEIASARLQ